MGLSYSKSDLFVLNLILLTSICLMSGCTDPGGPEAGTISIQNRLEIYRSSSVPPLDNPQDKIWNDALTGSILLGEDNYPGDFDVPSRCFLKAIIAGDRFYLRAEWSDAGRDVWPNKIVHARDTVYDTITENPLLIDTIVNVSWVRAITYTEIYQNIVDTAGDSIGVDTSSIRYDQDRFAIMWDMGNNGDEGADCLTMCHVGGNPVSGHRMYTTGGGQVDVWQWMAAMSDPLLLARDEYWGADGRADDEGDSLALSNYDFFLSEPVYAHPDDNDDTDPFLFSSSAIDLASGKDRPSGYTLPGYLLNEEASGSITDVSGYSHFGVNTLRWIVLMSRPLSTGHPDDIDLSQVAPGDSVMVSIAVMNNADRLHAGSKPFYVVFPE